VTIGPVQLLVFGFEDPKSKGEILSELERLRELDIVRLVDLIAVRKDADGNVDVVHQSDLSVEEAEQVGALAGALIGLGMDGDEGAERGAELGAAAGSDGHLLDEDAWYVVDAIPNGTAAAVALIEHRWAIPLREAIAREGGVPLADAWIHPRDLVAIGLAAAERGEPAAA
jgi:uncharacterized membrane protein